MKIGIVTFHRAVNYGAILQAYALTETLKLLGHEAEVIDYRSKFIEEYYDAKCLLKPKNWKRLVANVFYNGNLNPDKERLYSFLKETNSVSEKTYSAENIKRTNEVYDLFVCGSDQVWNYTTSGFDRNYFLEFVDNEEKKYSYAASFGFSSIPEQYFTEYKKLLINFQNYSVREDAGCKIIAKLLDKNATVDLDPTLLLEKKYWEDVCDTNNEKVKNLILQKYVLVYMISEDLNAIQLANNIAKRLNCKVVYLNDRWKKRNHTINLSGTTIKEWVTLFDNAEFIVTNSFHGAAFSINLNRQFLVLQNSNTHKAKSRIDTLLKTTGLTNRYVNSVDEGNARAFSTIDYEPVNELLNRSRAMSKTVLLDIVENRGKNDDTTL